MTPKNFWIASIEVGHGLMVRLSGELDMAGAEDVRRFVETEFDTKYAEIRFDCRGVTFIDSIGVKLLDDLVRRGATIVGCSGFIAELLSPSPLRLLLRHSGEDSNLISPPWKGGVRGSSGAGDEGSEHRQHEPINAPPLAPPSQGGERERTTESG
jgi:anti-anti-sigma factor